MSIQHNQTWDTEGNLLFEEYIEVPDEPIMNPKEAARQKLRDLGLTDEEIDALIGAT